jgi:hypothetical protein
MRLSNALVAMAIGFTLGIFTLGTVACHEEGPAERAGKQIDKVAQDTSDAMKDASKKLDDKMEDAGEKMPGK